jgi:hypothetical protein
MAGRQRRKEMAWELERRLAEWTQTQDEGSYDVLDYACSWVASGHTLTKLTDEISETLKWDISRDMLMRYLKDGRPDAARRLEQARLDGAHGMVDQGIKIIDDASTADKEQLMKAKMQAEIRQWTAERWNRKELGRAPEVQITVNNNTLHIDAMRTRQVQLSNHEERVLEPAQSRARLIDAKSLAHDEDVIADVVSIESGES